MNARARLFSTCVLAALLSACTVGPDFHAPVTVPPNGSLLAGHISTAGAELTERPVSDLWWEDFGDPVLTTLEQRVASQSLDVGTASARLEQARAQRRIAGGAAYPSLGATASYARVRPGPDGRQGSQSVDIFESGFDAVWEIDLWGRTRRGIEAATARVEAAEDYRRLALLMVEAEVARDYIRLRGAEAELGLLRESIEIARSSVALTRSRFENGVTTRLDVANAAADLSTIEASIPGLEAERGRLANSLSLLLALPPRALENELLGEASIPSARGDIAIGIPSELLLRRPDIRQAESELHAATAEIGVAKADFYPRISLNGTFGGQTSQLSSFGSWASRQFSIGPAISLPFFEGGRLRGTLDLRKTEQQEAAIRYQQVVLAAWHDVDNALIDLAGETHRREALAHSVAENELAFSLAQRRYREGAIDFLNVLSVQKSLLNARSETIRSRTAASVALVKLFKALGGGWEQDFPRPRQSANQGSPGAADE
ncbi:efflux transporter outer membrane subunit [Sphingopyxis fribergensis]